MFKMKSVFSIITATAIAFCAIADSAAAQAPGVPSLKPKIYLGGGSFTVTGPSASKASFDGSYSLLGGVGLPLSMGIEVMGKVHYHKLSASTLYLSLSPIDPEFKTLTYGLDAKLPFLPAPSPLRPYAMAGFGAYSLSSSLIPGSTSGVYYNIGAGVDVSIGPTLSFFGEAKYTSLAGDASLNILPFVFGIRVM